MRELFLVSAGCIQVPAVWSMSETTQHITEQDNQRSLLSHLMMVTQLACFSGITQTGYHAEAFTKLDKNCLRDKH